MNRVIERTIRRGRPGSPVVCGLCREMILSTSTAVFFPAADSGRKWRHLVCQVEAFESGGEFERIEAAEKNPTRPPSEPGRAIKPGTSRE